jgi:hypothetical protein
MRIMTSACSIVLAALLGMAASCSASEEAPQEQKVEFEVCDQCKTSAEFAKYAKYKAIETVGEHRMFVGNSNDGNLYLIKYSVEDSGSTNISDRFVIVINSAERQNEATRKHFRELIEVIRE